jgi:hypothetical protein
MEATERDLHVADLPPNDSSDGPRRGPDRASPPSTPRWVKLFGIIAALVVVAIVILALACGEHGPGRHLPGGNNPAGHTPPVQHSY